MGRGSPKFEADNVIVSV
ncbi:hypothetical protein SSYM_1375, partial [Serratia symbiotica str. Tucson]